MRFAAPLISSVPGDRRRDDGHFIMGCEPTLVGFNLVHCVWRYGYLRGTYRANACGVHSGDNYYWVVSTHNGKMLDTFYGVGTQLPPKFNGIIDDDNVFMKTPDALPEDIG